MVFTVWAFLSSFWAEDLPLTLKRLAVFGIFVIASVAVARSFSPREIILWTFFTTSLFLMIAIAAEMVFGNFQPFVPGYRFAGPTHPNTQGCDCALLVLSALAAADTEKRWRTLFRIGALVGFAFLMLTQSRTAIAAALPALAVYFAVVLPKPGKIAMAYGLSLSFCVCLFCNLAGVLPSVKSVVALGRVDDGSSVESFNGRTGVWNDVTYYIERRPLIGYGYGGFWTPSRISLISGEEGWPIRDSHSTYIEYLATLGAVGMFAYALVLFAGIWRAYALWRLSGNTASAFYAALLIFCALSGFLEGVVSDPSLLMFLSMAMLAQLAFVLRKGSVVSFVVNANTSNLAGTSAGWLI